MHKFGFTENKLMADMVEKLVKSWADQDGIVVSLHDIFEWIADIKANTHVDITECSINESTFWFYDDYNGEVLNRKRSFFSVKGMRMFRDNTFVKEQPMIIQPEIGYLGIICKEIEGELHFLMQAKIEPGNINFVQISPTIQATKSNFTRAHGGNLPPYFQYFENASKYQIICDTIQPEQSARFYKKKNRNIVILVNEDVTVEKNYCWMTLGQLKCLLKCDNIVNMDTRTVLSCLPFGSVLLSDREIEQIKQYFDDAALMNSMIDFSENTVMPVKYTLNNFKMYHDIKTTYIPLNELADWEIDEYGIYCKKPSEFIVKYYKIHIEGREVHEWNQPLFKAVNSALFGLLTTVIDNKRYFLISIRNDIGTDDIAEIAPSVQLSGDLDKIALGEIDRLFLSIMKNKEPIADVMLSEEGGRFYHEENRNVIIEINNKQLEHTPEGYFWLDYAAIIGLLQTTTLVNIQMRNLLALLEI